MSEMKLSILDRIQMSSLMPERGNLIDMTLQDDIGTKVRVTQEEMAATSFAQEPSPQGVTYKWDRAKEVSLNVDMTPMEVDYLNKQVDRLDKESLITRDLMPLCRKIRDLKADART